MSLPHQSFETQIVCHNPASDDPHGATSMPIYQTATFAQPSATEFGAYDYTRSGNPTRDAAQKLHAIIDGAKASFCFSTGMAAISAVTRFASAGEEIIVSDDSYGGTYRLVSKVCTKHGIKVKFVDLSGAQGALRLKNALSIKTTLVMMESPTNPLMRVCDIRKLSSVILNHHQSSSTSKTKRPLLCVDNTIMTGVLMQPLSIGADLCLTSCTKFACGHSDTMAGVVSCNDPQLAHSIYFTQNSEGSGLAPFDCFLLLRGIKTLPLRMERAQFNALKVAQFLASHTSVTKVFYAGLVGHEDRDIHFSQASGAGSVVCFTTGSYERSRHIASMAANTGLYKITVSFGSVNSLISLPGDMSHASIPSEVKESRAFPMDLVRISVGIENFKDLVVALKIALDSPMQHSGDQRGLLSRL